MDYLPQFGQNVDQQMPQDDAMMQLELQRRMKFADALRQQEAPQGQMISGHYVAPSWTQHLAGLANKYMAGQQEQNAMQQYGEAQKTKAQKIGEIMKGQTVFEPDEQGNQREVTKPYSNEELIAQLSGVDSSYAPKLLDAYVANQFKDDQPMVVGKNLVTKSGKVLFSSPEEPKSQYANVQQDQQTGKFYGVNLKTNQVEQIPGAAMSPKPAMTPYEEQSLGLRRQEINKKEANNFDSETIDMLADQALTGDKSVFSGRGMTGANIGAIRQRMNQKMRDKGWSGADIAAANAQFAGLMAGERTAAVKGANVEMPAYEFQGLLPLASEASKQVSRSGLLPFGKVQIMFDEQTNDPALRQFAAVNNGIVNTYARAISPTGVPTVSDKEHARKLLSTAYDQKSYQATLDMMNREIETAKRAPGKVRENLHEAISGRGAIPQVNAQGWKLHKDAAGRQAYVGPNGEIQEVR